jgi:hypothetical protein
MPRCHFSYVPTKFSVRLENAFKKLGTVLKTHKAIFLLYPDALRPYHIIVWHLVDVFGPFCLFVQALQYIVCMYTKSQKQLHTYKVPNFTHYTKFKYNFYLHFQFF